MRARRTVVVIGAIAAVAVLAGCAGDPGMVVEIDGRTITEAELDRVAEELGPFLTDASRGAVLTALVQSEAGIVLGERNDIEVTDKQARTFLNETAEKAAVEPSEWGKGSLTIARMQVLREDLALLPDPEAATAQYEEILAGLDVTVNPRYGEYDPATGEIRALQHDWIVVPAADAQPSAE